MVLIFGVLNLIINGIPSIHKWFKTYDDWKNYVLNLIINGIPSILSIIDERN